MPKGLAAETVEIMPKSDIVFGSEFSPAVIDLAPLLVMVKQHQPDRSALQQAIDDRFFPGKGKNADPKKTLADNTILAMLAYGLLERGEDRNTVFLSDFGESLHEKRESIDDLRDMMGRHCLVELNGLRIISCIQDLLQAGIPLKKVAIARQLRREGFHVPQNGKHLNVLRQWLDFAGVLNANNRKGGEGLWIPDESRLDELLRITTADIERWGELTPPQYDFARAFALMGVDEAVSSSVRDSAVTLYGTEFPEGGLPQSVLHKLADVGLITWKKTTRGRGAKAHLVYPTDKLKSELLEPILAQIAHELGPGYKRLSRMSFLDIVTALGSASKHEKGIALEALAFYFCRRLDLQFVQWRLRGNATGGAEVDLIVEGTRLIFSRWQIQCKNTKRVATEDLAKEVGIATAIRSNVVMLISTGDVGAAVRKFAKMVMQNTALHVILLSGIELKKLVSDPSTLTRMLNTQAAQAMMVKRPQLEG